MHKFFDSQLDDEKIYLVIREHPILLALRLVFVVFLGLLGVAAQIAASIYLPDIVSETTLTILLLFIYIYHLGLLLGGLLVIVFYYLSLQIITDMRMVDVDQHGLFKRKVTEIQIENVEEVTSHTTGILATIFNYGHVLVQTSGAVAEFEFNRVSHPEHVKKIILDLYEKKHKSFSREPLTSTPT